MTLGKAQVTQGMEGGPDPSKGLGSLSHQVTGGPLGVGG